MALKKVLILGTGKLARDLVPYLKKSFDELEFASTFDDAVGTRFSGYPVVSIHNIRSYDRIVIASSDSEEIIQSLMERFPEILDRVKVINFDEPFLEGNIYNNDSQVIISKIRFFFFLPYALIFFALLVLSHYIT
jgi:hypothetical protein